MTQTEHRTRSRAERIERLRTRLKNATTVDALRSVMLGILDLLDDEL